MTRRLRTNAALSSGLLLLAVILIFVTVGQFWTPHDPFALDFAAALQPPSAIHWLGTDDLGRDILSRIMRGGLVDLQVVLICVVVPGVLGGIIGAVAGYVGGVLDLVLMRITDVLFAFPFIVLVIAIVGALGPSTLNLYIAIILVNWISFARIVRGETLIVRELDYVLAARALEYSTARIVFRHVLPNAATPAIVFAMADMVLTILAVTSLSFLGLGIQPPVPEWGLMVADGRNYLLDAWWMATFPGLAIVIAGISFALIGDGLDTALRPKG